MTDPRQALNLTPAAVLAALSKYGRHVRGCNVLMPVDSGHCSCGLDTALTALRAGRASPGPEARLDESIRRTLWMACPHDMKYGDDGELQCRGVDFRRADLAALAAHVRDALSMAIVSEGAS